MKHGRVVFGGAVHGCTPVGPETAAGATHLRLADGRVLEGTAKQIAESMHALAFGQENRTLSEYIDWAVDQARRMNEIELDVTGATYPREWAGQPIQPFVGRSLAPLFRGTELPADRWLHWEQYDNKAVRHGAWKRRPPARANYPSRHAVPPASSVTTRRFHQSNAGSRCTDGFRDESHKS